MEAGARTRVSRCEVIQTLVLYSLVVYKRQTEDRSCSQPSIEIDVWTLMYQTVVYIGLHTCHKEGRGGGCKEANEARVFEEGRMHGHDQSALFSLSLLT